MEAIRLTFVQFEEYHLSKAHFDRLYKMGTYFIEKVRNIYFGRMYWIPGRTVYSEVGLVLADKNITANDQYKDFDEQLDDDREAFLKLHKQAPVGCRQINQL